jgi:hypothetical protein
MDSSTLFYAYEKAKEEMRVSVMAMVASGNRDSRELATHNRYARLAGKLAKRITTPQGAAEKERDELRRQLEEARATILEIMTELTKAGYQFMHEGEEPVIECCDCEFPLAEGHADDCNRPR